VIELEHIKTHCDAIEEWYEFMLAFAAQGIADDRESPHGSQLRQLLAGAIDAASKLPASYSAMAASVPPASRQKYMNFLDVLKRDTANALAAMELVLVQAKISSQLVDNLNASLHVRTLLTDVFLLDEIAQVWGGIHCVPSFP
jgi:hypothetical protein